MANDDTNYTIELKSITSHGIKGIEFDGFSLGYDDGAEVVVGKLFLSKGGDLSPGGDVTCVAVPAAQATSCVSKQSLDADDWTPVEGCVVEGEERCSGRWLDVCVWICIHLKPAYNSIMKFREAETSLPYR